MPKIVGVTIDATNAGLSFHHTHQIFKGHLDKTALEEIKKAMEQALPNYEMQTTTVDDNDLVVGVVFVGIIIGWREERAISVDGT